jgi:hypothetical protein
VFESLSDDGFEELFKAAMWLFVYIHLLFFFNILVSIPSMGPMEPKPAWAESTIPETEDKPERIRSTSERI